MLLVPEYEVLEYGEGNRRSWGSTMYVDYVLARDPGYFHSLPIADQFEIAMMTPFDRLAEGLKSTVRTGTAGPFRLLQRLRSGMGGRPRRHDRAPVEPSPDGLSVP